MSTATDSDVVRWLDEHCASSWSVCRAAVTWQAYGRIGGTMRTVYGSSAAEARLTLAQAFGMGATAPLPPCTIADLVARMADLSIITRGQARALLEGEAVEAAAADPCPLPKVWEWEWRETSPNKWRADACGWSIYADSWATMNTWWSWVVITERHEFARGITRTRRGAMRAAERAARRAWHVRNSASTGVNP